MSNLRFDKKGNKKFWSGKGFYVALALCLVAVGGTAWGVLNSSPLSTGGDESIANPIVVDWDSKAPVNNPASDIPMESSSPASTDSSKASSKDRASKTESSKPGASSTASTVTYAYPVAGEVLKAFSGEKLVYSETLGDWRVHDGTDFKCTAGEGVKSISEGLVTKITDDPMWGKMIEIDHGKGIIAVYSGLEKVTEVAQGTRVTKGQVIGKVGELPVELSDGPHLHLKITKNDVLVDPVTILGKR